MHFLFAPVRTRSHSVKSLPEHESYRLPILCYKRRLDPYADRRSLERLGPPRRVGLLQRSPRTKRHLEHLSRRLTEMLRKQQHGSFLRLEVRTACHGEDD